MKTIIIDLDDTITCHAPSLPYAAQRPNHAVIARLQQYRDDGFRIAIHTARNMRSHNGDIGVINAKTLPVILEWLQRHDVPYDAVHIGKPWCGDGGFYVDDKAIRPDEFANLPYDEIKALIGTQVAV